MIIMFLFLSVAKNIKVGHFNANKFSLLKFDSDYIEKYQGNYFFKKNPKKHNHCQQIVPNFSVSGRKRVYFLKGIS